MSAALSSPTIHANDSLLTSASSRSLTVVSSAELQHDSEGDSEAATDELSAPAMDMPHSGDGGNHPAAAAAPGAISEEGSSSHGDSADVVMEGTAEPEESPDHMISDPTTAAVEATTTATAASNTGAIATVPATTTDEQSGPGDQVTAQATAADPDAVTGDAEQTSQPQENITSNNSAPAAEQEDSSSEDDDDAASHTSSDYDHRFFLESFQEDTSSPSEEEAAEMDRRKDEPVSAFDVDHWVKQCFTQLPSNPDPEYEIIPEIHQLTWTMSPVHGTLQDPNRAPFSRSPPIKITAPGGKEFDFGLKIFPHGNDGTEMVSVFLECYEHGGEPGVLSSSATWEDPEWWEVTAQVGCVMYNSSDPTINTSQKAAHQFTAINPDFGWTRFHGPWSELHKRKHLQARPMLQRDSLSFVVYIRLVRDSTRALWWHNLQDHRNDWDPVLKTGYRGYHIDSQPSGYSALISALAVWFELPAFRKLVESARIPDVYEEPRDSYQTLLVALKKALHAKLASRKAGGNSKRLAYLDGIYNALVKSGSRSLLNPFDVWAAIERILKREISEAESKGNGSLDLFNEFFSRNKLIEYSIEPTFPLCGELDDVSNNDSHMATSTELVKPPATAQAVISLAASEDHASSDVLHVELPRQAYDPERRRWTKVTTKIEIEETIRFQEEEYQLFGLVSHSGELGNLRFNPVLRPRGPGSQWLRWSVRCNHTTRGYVVPQTCRQAIESHQGAGTSSTVAYVLIYVKATVLQSIAQGVAEREPHDVYNPLPLLPSKTVEEPDKFKVVVHSSEAFARHTDNIGFLDPWAEHQDGIVLELSKDDTIFDLRNQIRSLDQYKEKQFGLYRLLLDNANHRLDAQVRDEKLENPVFMPAISCVYGIHFLLHILNDEHAKIAKEQHDEIAQVHLNDSSRDIHVNAEMIMAERDSLHQASLPPPPPIVLEDPPAPVPVESPATTDPESNDEDVVMSGTEEVVTSSTGAAAPVENQVVEQTENSQGGDAATETGPQDSMEQEATAPQESTQEAKPEPEGPSKVQQLLESVLLNDAIPPAELTSCMSEPGRALIAERIGRSLHPEESEFTKFAGHYVCKSANNRIATCSFAARYPGENRVHFFNLIPNGPGVTGSVVGNFTLQKLDSIGTTETIQKPHNHALIFVKHYFPSKGPALESASAMLVSRDTILKEALKRPSSNNEIVCYLERPGEVPFKLQGDSSLADNNISTGCVLITDPIMPELLATTLNKRGLPSSVTDFLEPHTGFTTGFGRGWAKCETLHGRAHGQGRIVYPDGDAYEGQLVSGRRQGKGTMFYATGNTFRGDWHDDLPNGSGTIVYSDTLNKYEGPFKDGRPHGGGGVTYWKKAEAGSRICRICLDEEMNSALIPCGHMVVCVGCGGQLSECPVCRTGIDRVQRIWDCSQT